MENFVSLLNKAIIFIIEIMFGLILVYFWLISKSKKGPKDNENFSEMDMEDFSSSKDEESDPIRKL